LKEKKQKVDTLAITVGLIELGNTIAEIAELRDMAVSTITEHIVKIKSAYPSLNLDIVRPGEDCIKLVHSAFAKLSETDFNEL